MSNRNHGADASINSLALAKLLVIRAAACRVYDVVASSTSASKIYLQLHDAAAVPANGAVPLAFAEMDGTSTQKLTGTLSWAGGRQMKLGAVVVISSTAATLTIALANEVIIDATYTGQGTP